MKRASEPSLCETNLCETCSDEFSVKIDLRFTFSQSSHIKLEPVNLGSHLPKRL
jgi:hypothetical protein